MASTTLIVNGESFLVDLDREMPLLWALRDVLDLTGTKYSCGKGLCGSCTIHLDGEAARSCVTPVSAVGSRVITTIEGLGGPEGLHPIQQSFVDTGAIQCGFCTPGIIMTAKAFLDENQNPSRDDIKDALSGNFCRCTGHIKTVEAVERAARSGGEGEHNGQES